MKHESLARLVSERNALTDETAFWRKGDKMLEDYKKMYECYQNYYGMTYGCGSMMTFEQFLKEKCGLDNDEIQDLD